MTTERDRKIAELARQGVPPREIAAEVGLASSTVSDILRRLRREGENIPRFTGGRPQASGCTVRLDPVLIASLEWAAERRGMTRDELLERLVEGCLFDGHMRFVLAGPRFAGAGGGRVVS